MSHHLIDESELTDHLVKVAERWEEFRSTRESVLHDTLQGLNRSDEDRMIQKAMSTPSLSGRVMWLRKAADGLIAKTASVAACKPGCSSCCHIGVQISRDEAEVIAKAIKRPLNKKAGKLVAPPDLKEFHGVPCLFLKSNRCSIYEHRPVACRTHINVDKDDLLCRLLPQHQPAVEVPYIDKTHYTNATISVLGVRGGVDDLRNWFGR